jgi:hypothetical protein
MSEEAAVVASSLMDFLIVIDNLAFRWKAEHRRVALYFQVRWLSMTFYTSVRLLADVSSGKQELYLHQNCYGSSWIQPAGPVEGVVSEKGIGNRYLTDAVSECPEKKWFLSVGPAKWVS